MLWDSLQEICYKQDQRFLEDVSRILGVPASDVKKRILGIRGAPTAVLVESGPWWVNTTCSIQSRGPGGMWKRCGRLAEPNTYCWEHRHFRTSSDTMKLYTDSYFDGMKKRWPIQYMSEIVWVDEEGTVLRNDGTQIPKLHIHYKTGLATYASGNERGIPT